MTKVLRTTGFKTKCEAVEAGLRLLLDPFAGQAL
ncbi:hypothetical protein [Sphingobium indicum]